MPTVNPDAPGVHNQPVGQIPDVAPLAPVSLASKEKLVTAIFVANVGADTKAIPANRSAAVAERMSIPEGTLREVTAATGNKDRFLRRNEKWPKAFSEHF